MHPDTSGLAVLIADAEAERERRAKAIHAEGELQAAEKLFQAAQILAQEPQAIQLRYLETLTVIGADSRNLGGTLTRHKPTTLNYVQT